MLEASIASIIRDDTKSPTSITWERLTEETVKGEALQTLCDQQRFS